LFSNNSDPEIIRKAGFNSDYLQIGFDNVWYNKRELTPNMPEIVYLCNEYGTFPESAYRVEIVKSLMANFGDRFKIHGAGWDRHGIKTNAVNNHVEYSLYNSAKIAISVSNFNLSKYYSDRLLRIMACGGAVAMSHDFKDLKTEFTPDKDIVVFIGEDEYPVFQEVCGEIGIQACKNKYEIVTS
jgi:spore maturation protein CgeB